MPYYFKLGGIKVMDRNAKMKSAKKGNKKVIIAGIGIIIVLLIAIIVLLVMRKEKPEEKRNVVVTKDNVEEVTDDMLNQEYIEPGYYSTSMSTLWHFSTGDAISEDAFVENLEENTNDVYFDVFLADNEEEAIYKSPLLPRGSELNNISLDTSLAAGTYDGVVIYHLVDEEQNTISTLRVGITIIIEG